MAAIQETFLNLGIQSILTGDFNKSSISLRIESEFSQNVALLMLAIERTTIENEDDCKSLIQSLANLSSELISEEALKNNARDDLDALLSSLERKINEYLRGEDLGSLEESQPHEYLQYVLKTTETSEAELEEILNISEPHRRSILNGVKPISRDLALKLGEEFNLDPNNFVKRL